MKRLNQNGHARLVMYFAVTTGLALSLLGCQKKPIVQTPSTFDTQEILKVRKSSGPESNPQILISTGNPAEAARYAQHIKDDLQIDLDANLDSVISFCGYSGLTAREIEITPSDQLMARFPGDVISSRFFAPKIIDVSNAGGPATGKPLGWRKVVRLSTKTGSLAAAKGISSMFLLFNVFQDRTNVASDPFALCATDPTRCSKNNQAMLIVGSPQAGKDTAYWLVFETASVSGGKRTDNLVASFDGGDFPAIPSATPLQPYYIPRACAECHGGSSSQAKLNYLDSDHWNDRVQDGDDFPIVRTNSSNGVVFDGGRDTTSTGFKSAFSAVKTLNTEIRDQNRTAGGEDFQLRAVENWLALHATNIDFLPPIDRAIPPPASNPGAHVWNRANPDDEATLKLLDQFCFRCHSSVIYHVFDKEAVFQRKDSIARRLDSGTMPQDRILDTAEWKPKRDDLIKFIKALK